MCHTSRSGDTTRSSIFSYFLDFSIRLTELVTPLKPLEAMSLSKAVLASGVGGHRELVQHEVTGLLFRPEDVEDFCVHAERLMAIPHSVRN